MFTWTVSPGADFEYPRLSAKYPQPLGRLVLQCGPMLSPSPSLSIYTLFVYIFTYVCKLEFSARAWSGLHSPQVEIHSNRKRQSMSHGGELIADMENDACGSYTYMSPAMTPARANDKPGAIWPASPGNPMHMTSKPSQIKEQAGNTGMCPARPAQAGSCKEISRGTGQTAHQHPNQAKG